MKVGVIKINIYRVLIWATSMEIKDITYWYCIIASLYYLRTYSFSLHRLAMHNVCKIVCLLLLIN